MTNNTFAPDDDVSTIVKMFGAQLPDAAKPLTLLVRMTMREGTREEVDAAFARARRLTLQEAGALAFELNRDASDANAIVVYEAWRSLADLEAHLRTPHVAALRAAFDAMIVGNPEFTVLTPVTETRDREDYRVPSSSKMAPRAVADGGGGTIIAAVDLDAAPERVFRALSTDEVEHWWGHPHFYRQEAWSADLRVCGSWSVLVRFPDGSTNLGSGEFAEIDAPNKLVMTRRFEHHPLQGARETTITYRLDPIATGTRLTVRDEGFIGRSQAAYGNAEHWERVLGWLEVYLRTASAANLDQGPSQ